MPKKTRKRKVGKVASVSAGGPVARKAIVPSTPQLEPGTAEWEALMQKGLSEYFWIKRRLAAIAVEEARLQLRRQELYRALVLSGVEDKTLSEPDGLETEAKVEP